MIIRKKEIRMIGLKNYLTEEENRLRRIKQIVDNRLQGAPEGCLRISSCRKKPNYMYCTEENGKLNKQGHYLKKDNVKIIQALAQKGYDRKIKFLVDKRIKQIHSLNNDYNDEEIEKIFNNLSDKRKELVKPVEMTWEQRLKQWKSTPYTGKEFKEGTIEIYTKKGERVRSKSEKILADMFFDMGVEYKYECPLQLNGYGLVYPDFTFLSKKTNKEIYWEHDGRMDEAEYAEKAIRKIDQYTKNGIIPGVRLILTYETSHYALNMSVAKNLICNYLL